jgi:hypothetical protein
VTVNVLWPGSVFVVEWDLVDDAGEPMNTATVAGTIVKPSGDTVPMDVQHEPGTNTYRGSYQPAQSGQFGWKLAASGDGQGVVEGTFVVSRETTGAEPIIVDPADPVGMMRLLTTDVDEAFPILTDDQYRAFLTLENNIIKCGAAAALEAIATSETLRSKKISTQDLSIDGPAVAADLRARAKLLRDQVRQDITNQRDDENYADGFGFDFLDFNPHASRWPGIGC